MSRPQMSSAQLETPKTLDDNDLSALPSFYSGCSPQHILNDLSNSHTLTDLQLQSADEVIFHGHRAVLSAAVPYLKALFQFDQNNRLHEAFLSIASSKALTVIMQFANGTSLCLDKNNVEEALVAADAYLVGPLSDKCFNFLLKHMSIENYNKITYFKHLAFCKPEFENQILEFGCRSVMKWAELYHEQFKTLDITVLQEILQSDILYVRSERDVEHLIGRWVDGKDNAVAYTEQLSVCVRQLWTENNNRDNYYHPRVPQHLIFVIGGYQSYEIEPIVERELEHCSSAIQVYDMAADSWLLLKTQVPLPQCIHYAVVAVEYKLYIVGGITLNGMPLAHLSCYDTVTDIWQQLGPMDAQRARSHLNAVAHANKIYAIGGSRLSHACNYFDAYDVNSNLWSILPGMRRRRLDSASCVYNDCIFVAGGYRQPKTLSDVEVFHINSGSWSEIRRLLWPICGFSLIAYDSHLYAFGGVNINRTVLQPKVENRCSKYSFSTKKWNFVKDMPFPRMSQESVVVDNILYVMGGVKQAPSADLDIYDFKKNLWIPSAPLKQPLFDFRACVISHSPGRYYYCQNAILKHPNLARVKSNATHGE